VTDHPVNPDQPLSSERDIRPLFREKDRSSMLKAFDLWSHVDVVAHEDAILDQVRAGTCLRRGMAGQPGVRAGPLGHPGLRSRQSRRLT
jgi:hypothetical protein